MKYPFFLYTEHRISEKNKLDDQHKLPILNSSYNICIRKESGYSCVQYTPCSDTPTFSVSGTATSKTGSNCSTDWLEIQGGTTCGGSNTLINRYCGSKFYMCVRKFGHNSFIWYINMRHFSRFGSIILVELI